MVSCWGITDGSTGMVAQVRALAEALGLSCEMKTVALKRGFGWQPNALYAAGYRHLILPYALDKKRSDDLSQPWPDIIISCGRKAALIAMGMKDTSLREAQEGAKLPRFIHIQDPQVPAHFYDLVIAMQHDRIEGANVIKVRLALHRVTPQALAQAAEQFAPHFAAFTKPHIAVLLGGSTNKYTLSRRAMKHIISQLEQLLAGTPGSLLITPSRRTGEENTGMLRKAFAGNKRVYLYDGISENPYMGMLALADAIVVSNDSVNMMSEARAAGKPLYILALRGHRKTKPARFAEGLIAEGVARPLSGTLESWNYPPSKQMEELAALVKELMALP